MNSVAVGQIWRVSHAQWPDRFIRVLAIRAGTVHATRCDASGGRYPRTATYRIGVADLERGTNPSFGLSYSPLFEPSFP